MNNSEELLTPEDLAKRWKMTAQRLAEWRCEEIHFHKHIKIGGGVRYKLSDVLEYEKQ